jgi:hypothetical protein
LTSRKPKARITKSRTVNTYAELWHGSDVLLQKAEADEKGSAWVLMSSLLLTAFTLEAYLNHIGQRLFGTWPALEVLSPMSKLDVISEKLDLSFPRANRPRQTIEQLFRFRNALAHGKTEIITAPDELRDADEYLDEYLGQRPLTEWEKLLTSAIHAKRARDDVEDVIRTIHKAGKPENDPVFFSGIGSHSATLEP